MCLGTHKEDRQMLKVLGVALPLVGALALVGCAGSNGAKGDKGVPLPDVGPPGDLSPDRGPDPDQKTGGDGDSSVMTCSEIMSCAANCIQGDRAACQQYCVAQGSTDAQAKFQAMQTCYDTAKTGSCASKCTSFTDQACRDCIAQACLAEITACQTSAPVTSSNSGAICSQAQACPDPGEGCLLFQQGATKGMCLGKCDAQGDSCKVANPATQLSKCVISLQGSSALYCGWLCEMSGQTYKCPNDTDYDCKSLNPQDPNTKYCVPK
jgi:hypothetical protein